MGRRLSVGVVHDDEAMSTRVTFILLLIIAALVLLTLDRLQVQEHSWHQQKMLCKASSHLAQHLTDFFRERTGAMKAMEIALGAQPPGAAGSHFGETAEALFSALPGVTSVALLERGGDAVAAWPRPHDGTGHRTSPFHDLGLVRDLAAEAISTSKMLVSGAFELPDGDFAFLVMVPLGAPSGYSPRLVAGEFRVWSMIERRFRLIPHGMCTVFLEDPDGNCFPKKQRGRRDPPAQTQALLLGNSTWKVHVQPSETKRASMGFARVMLWGLGLELILSFLLFYFLLARKNARLEENAQRLGAQARTLREFNERLVRANRDLDDFTYVVSHDLKEPLRGIEGLTKLLLEEEDCDKPDGAGHEYLCFIQEASHRMQRLVRDLLKLSRTTRRQYPHEETDFNDLVGEVVGTLRYAIDQKKARIEVQANLPRISCDRVRTAELLQNLISNALKFTNGRRPVIRIGHEARADANLFWVTDNGEGIQPKDRERIFQIFQRIHDGTPQEGTGVGLTICKRIVERAGGEIWVESEPGLGSRFCFTLPKRPTEPGTTAGTDAASGEAP